MNTATALNVYMNWRTSSKLASSKR